MEVRAFEEIDAPADVVWEVLTDLAGHDAWDPMMKGFRGRLEEGAIVSFSIVLGPLRAPVPCEVLRVRPARELRWVGPASKLARRAAAGEHYFALTPVSAKVTRIEHGEDFTGWLVPRRAEFLVSRLRPMYAAFNRAIKREAEKRVRDSHPRGAETPARSQTSS
jgi:hypothetical protein